MRQSKTPRQHKVFSSPKQRLLNSQASPTGKDGRPELELGRVGLDTGNSVLARDLHELVPLIDIFNAESGVVGPGQLANTCSEVLFLDEPNLFDNSILNMMRAAKDCF